MNYKLHWPPPVFFAKSYYSTLVCLVSAIRPGGEWPPGVRLIHCAYSPLIKSQRCGFRGHIAKWSWSVLPWHWKDTCLWWKRNKVQNLLHQKLYCENFFSNLQLINKKKNLTEVSPNLTTVLIVHILLSIMTCDPENNSSKLPIQKKKIRYTIREILLSFHCIINDNIKILQFYEEPKNIRTKIGGEKDFRDGPGSQLIQLLFFKYL